MMTKMILHKISVAVSLIILLCSITLFFCYKKESAYAKSIDDLFVTHNIELNEGCDEYEQSCLKIIPKNKNAFVDFAEEVSGDFDIELSFNNSLLKEIDIAIKSIDSEFVIVVENKDDFLNVSVKAFGEQFGIYYSTENIALGKTREMNANGNYTFINDKRLHINFDPQNMLITANDLTVWDFLAMVNDWKESDIILPMAEYEISLMFPYCYGENGVYIYSIMNEKSDSPIILDHMGPNIFADVALNAQVNSKYILPHPYAYDLSDGKIDDIKVSVDKIVNEIPQPILEKIQYTQHMSVDIESSGEYRITYFATDSKGKESYEEYFFQATQKKTECEFVSDQASFPDILGLKSRIVIPSVTVKNNLFIDTDRCDKTSLVVMKDGCILKNNIAEHEEFIFDSVGNYEFIYTPVLSSVNEKYIINFTIDANYPALRLNHVQNKYKCNDKPDLQSKQIIDCQSEYSETVLLYPDGTIKKSNKYLLNQQGEYVLRSTAVVDGKKFIFERKFFTQKQKAYISPNNENILYSDSSYVNQNGIAFTLKNNETFVYDDIIELNNDSDTPIIELYITPFVKGKAEANMIDIRLTDINDENNYITIRSSCFWKDPYTSFMTAGVKNNRKVGWEGEYLRTTPERGTFAPVSHAGLSTKGKYYPVSFSFNSSTGEVYLLNETLSSGKTLVTNLKSHKEHDEIFNGFSTNIVKLSISVYDAAAVRSAFLLTSVNGEKIFDLYGQTKSYTDIDINFDGYDENKLPYAIEGLPYKLFDACCVNANGKEIPVDKNVYLNYEEDNQFDISIKDDCFIPVYSGDYTVVYSVNTDSGDMIIRKYTVTCRSSDSDILEVDVIPPERIAKLGEKLELHSPQIINASGKIKKSITFVSPSGKAGDVGIGVFIPKETGKYKFTYTISDYIGRLVTKEYEVDIVKNDKPVFNNVIEIPEYFIYGEKYSLPVLTATDYSDGINEIPVIVTITENGIEREISVGDYYTPTTEDVVVITYKAVGKKGSNVLSFTSKIKKVCDEDEFGQTEFYLSEYFHGNNIRINADEKSVRIETVGKNAKFNYIYPLLSDGFNFKFNFDETHSSAAAMHIYLEDYLNESVSIKISFIRGENQSCYISLNDGEKIKTDYSMAGGGKDFILKYDSVNNILTDDFSYALNVDECHNGDVFLGFPNKKVNFRVEFEEDNADTVLLFKALNYQPFTSSVEDEVMPRISIPEYKTQIIKAGSEFDILEALAADVLDNDIKFTVSGNFGADYIMSTDGILLKDVPVKQYRIKFDKIGSYNFVYRATDRSGNSCDAFISFTVIDEEPPVITVNNDILIGKKGKTIDLPIAEAHDNETKELKIVIIAIRPDNVIENISGNQYTMKIAGKHIIRYMCIDEAGNVGYANIVLEVK